VEGGNAQDRVQEEVSLFVVLCYKSVDFCITTTSITITTIIIIIIVVMWSMV
jgi:hypothetical protein